MKIVLLDIDDTIFDFYESAKATILKCCKDFNIEFTDKMIAHYMEQNEFLWGQFEKKVITREDILNNTPAVPLVLKEGAEQIFDNETKTKLGVTMVSDQPEIVSADIKSKKAVALKPGKANITFSAKNGLAPMKQVVVEITVGDPIPEVPEEEPKLTDEEIKTEITKPDFNWKEQIPELGKKLPL